MPIDAKHEDLQSLRIDRTARTGGEGEPPVWARRYIIIGIAVLVLLGVVALAYRLFSRDVPEVEVVRAFPPDRVTELSISRWEELLRALEALGPVRVLVSNGAATIEEVAARMFDMSFAVML